MNYQESILTHSGGFDSTSKPHKTNQSSPPADTFVDLQSSKHIAEPTSQDDPLASLNSQSQFRPPPLPALKLPGIKFGRGFDGQVAQAAAPTSHPQETRGRSISNPEEKQLDSNNTSKSKQEPVVRVADLFVINAIGAMKIGTLHCSQNIGITNLY